MLSWSSRQPRLAAVVPYLRPAVTHVGWFGFFLLLSPIVGPRGYGMFILALSGIAIAEALVADTAVAALARLSVFTERQASAAFLMMLVVGGGMTLLLRGFGGVVGVTVDDSEFADIFRSLTLMPLLAALAVVPTARLRRDSRDAACAAASGIGFALGGLAALGAACAGAGAWALAAQVVVQRFTSTAVLWLAAGERIGLGWSLGEASGLIAAFDRRALSVAVPAAARYAPCLVAGVLLGPTAAALYLVATYLAEAIVDLVLAPAATRGAGQNVADRAGGLLLAASLSAALLPIAVPPLLGIGWWGAIRPAQLLLLGILPAAIGYMRRAYAGAGDAASGWRFAEFLGGTAAAVLAAPWGLTTMAAATITMRSTVALASLWPIRGYWRRGAMSFARPGTAAAASGALMLRAAAPVSMLFAPLPASCLLTAASRLCYLLVRGATTGGGQPARLPAPATPITAA